MQRGDLHELSTDLLGRQEPQGEVVGSSGVLSKHHRRVSVVSVGTPPEHRLEVLMLGYEQ